MEEKTGRQRAGKLEPDTIEIPHTDLSVYRAIYRRRMAWRFKDLPVSREIISRLLDTAVWAPNHRLTEPWRFFVLERDTPTRKRVAELAYAYSLEGNGSRGRAEAAREKVIAPPALVYVYSLPGANEEVTQENYAAVCCAVQNVSLAAVAEGLTVTWETGRITRHPELPAALGAEPDWLMVGALSIGVPDEELNPARTPAGAFISWL